MFNKNISIYSAVLEDEVDGITAVSLVKSPAVESNFIAFNKDEKKFDFVVENEEEHKILGCLLRADFPIYRIGQYEEEFYITFSKEVIEQMSKKMLSEHTFNNIDLEHDNSVCPTGVKLLELFIKDSEKGVNPKGFEDVADGSLFGVYHVENKELWEDVKNGDFKGFSVEAFLSLVKVDFKKQNKKTYMNILLNKLKKLLSEFGSVTAENGVELFYDGEEIAVGTKVTNAEGDATPDGEYVIAENVIIVKDGAVESIEPKVTEEEPETPAEEEPEQMEEETPETPAEEEPETTEEETGEIDALKAEIDTLKAEIEAVKAELEAMKNLLKEPKAEPIEEEFSKQQKRKAKENKASKFFEALGK